MNIWLHPRVRARVVSPCFARSPPIASLWNNVCRDFPAPRRGLQTTDTPLMSFFRPSGDITIKRGLPPKSERQPLTSFLRTTADCTIDDVLALLHASATHGIQERTSAKNEVDENSAHHNIDGKPPLDRCASQKSVATTVLRSS
jgi:hypothetical protein